MKVAPVSADLLIKLGLVAVAAWGVWRVYKKVDGLLPPVGDTLRNAIDGVGDAASSAVNWADRKATETGATARLWWHGVSTSDYEANQARQAYALIDPRRTDL